MCYGGKRIDSGTEFANLPVYQSKGWLKLLGVVLIINGVVAIFTLVGIVICWLPIWMGILLFKAASMIEVAQVNGDKVQLLESLKKIKTYFVINGVLMLIALIFIVISLIISGGALFSILDSF